MKIACIGSREISAETAFHMEQIGKFIVQQDWWLGSGNALGSDEAYARGANQVRPERVILYLPWSTYNAHLIHPLNKVTTESQEEWTDLAARYHPRYMILPDSVKKLMDRNAGIVRNADAVVAFRNRKKLNGGGTGHGYGIAQALEIPHLDISLPGNMVKAISWLQEIGRSSR